LKGNEGKFGTGANQLWEQSLGQPFSIPVGSNARMKRFNSLRVGLKIPNAAMFGKGWSSLRNDLGKMGSAEEAIHLDRVKLRI
jgi:hypothetical protein